MSDATVNERLIVHTFGSDSVTPYAQAAQQAAVEAEAARAAAVVAMNGAEGFSDEAAHQRDLAAAAALTAPNVYVDTTAGLAAVAEGETFWAEGVDGSIVLYRDVAGVADPLASMLTTTSLAGVSGADNIGYTAAGIDPYLNTVMAKLRDSTPVAITEFRNDDNSVPGSGGDDSSAMMRAMWEGRRIKIPAGVRIKCNVVTPPSFHIEGETSKLSAIEPFDYSKPAIKVAWDNLYWSYNRTIQDVSISNRAPEEAGYIAKSGIGIAMGRAGPDDFDDVGPYPQYSGGMVLRNVTFRDLHKGFVAGAGNIGVEFYSCNAALCYYGFYFLDNKNIPANGNTGGASGDIMHGGNKYFYGGEIDECKVGVYIHNVTFGFGCVVFYGTIIEFNDIGVYVYSRNGLYPMAFYDVWNEGNGQTMETPRTNINVDQWTGGTRSEVSMLPRTLIVDGDSAKINVFGGMLTDARIAATASRIIAREPHVETLRGHGGGSIDVVGAGTTVELHAPSTIGGLGTQLGVSVYGVPNIARTGNEADTDTGRSFTYSAARTFVAPPRTVALHGGMLGYAIGGFEGISIGYAEPRLLTGFASITTSVARFGRTFPYCAMVSATFPPSGLLIDNGASRTTTLAGWYVFSMDVRSLTGDSVTVRIGDLDTTQIWQASTVGSGWHTFAGLAYLPADCTFFPAFSPAGGAGAVAFYFGAYQARRFNTKQDAENFISSGAYVVDGDDLYLVNGGVTFNNGGVDAYRIAVNPVTSNLDVDAHTLTSQIFNADVNINLLLGREFRIDGQKVIGGRQPAIANAATGTEVTTINSILTAMRAHGLIA